MKRALLYLLIFIAVQAIVGLASTFVVKWLFPGVDAQSSRVMTITTLISNALIIILFLAFRWYHIKPFGGFLSAGERGWRGFSWLAVIWTVLLAIGIIMPLACVEQLIPETWKQDFTGDILVQMLQTTEGYFAICMLGPLAEEIVFRGAIITALKPTPRPSLKGSGWRGVLISSFFFAAAHFNPAQMPHAFIMGLLLGWLYVRTDSILLCFLVHWINNSAAYVFVKLFPNIPIDAPLEAYFGGSTFAVAQAVVCSLMIALPALYQLHRLLPRNKES